MMESVQCIKRGIGIVWSLGRNQGIRFDTSQQPRENYMLERTLRPEEHGICVRMGLVLIATLYEFA